MPLTLIVRGIFLFLKVKNYFKKSMKFSKKTLFLILKNNIYLHLIKIKQI